jgi:hypothetical protein
MPYPRSMSTLEAKKVLSVVGCKWNVEVIRWSTDCYSATAMTTDHMPYHYYCYDPVWEGESMPTDEMIAEAIDYAVERESEEAWESRLQGYY